jgi:hypothetical protein
LQQLDQSLRQLGVAHAQWYFDSPVSNSGRLKTLLYELATAQTAPWDVDLVFNPDTVLAAENKLTITADSWILDAVDAYFDLVGYTVQQQVPDALVWELF